MNRFSSRRTRRIPVPAAGLAAGLAAALTLLAAAPAYPESSKLEPPDTAGYVRWGPLRVRPSLQLQNVGYDDNIFSDNSNKVSDYRGTLSPRINGLVLLGNRAFLDFREQLDFTAYVDNSDQNFIDTRGRARLTVPLRRFGVFTDLTYNRIKERPFDQEDVRRTRSERRNGIGTILNWGWRTEIELGFRDARVGFSDPDLNNSSVSQLDRDESVAYVETSYRLRGRTDLLFDAKRESLDFDNAFVVNGESLDRDTDQETFRLGARLGDRGPVVGMIMIGRSRIQPNSSAIPSLSEFVGEAEIVYGLGTPTRFRLAASRQPGLAISGSNNYYLRDFAELRAVRYLSRAIGVEGSVNRGRLAFPGSLDGVERRDDITGWDAGVRFRLGTRSLGRKLEYSLRFGRFDRDSNIDDRDRSQNTFILDAVVDF